MLWLGVHFVSYGVHLHIFPVNYAWKIFFHLPGGAGAPTAPPGYAYGQLSFCVTIPSSLHWVALRKPVPSARCWKLNPTRVKRCAVEEIKQTSLVSRCAVCRRGGKSKLYYFDLLLVTIRYRLPVFIRQLEIFTSKTATSVTEMKVMPSVGHLL